MFVNGLYLAIFINGKKLVHKKEYENDLNQAYKPIHTRTECVLYFKYL